MFKLSEKNTKFIIGVIVIAIAFLLYFYELYLLRSFDTIDRAILSIIGFIILVAIVIWQATSMFKGKKTRPNYTMKGKWFKWDMSGKV